MATTTVYGAGAQISTNDTDIAALEAGLPVEVNAAGTVGAPNVLADSESRTVIANEATLAAKNGHTLPTAVAGTTYTFICNHTDGIRIVAAAADTIRLNGQVSIAAGYVESVVVGSAVQLVAIDATEWLATSVVGTWLVETS